MSTKSQTAKAIGIAMRCLIETSAALEKQLRALEQARRLLDGVEERTATCPGCGAREGEPHAMLCVARVGMSIDAEMSIEEAKQRVGVMMTKAKMRTIDAEEQAKDDWEEEHGVRPKVIIGMDRGMPKTTAQPLAGGPMLDEIRAALRSSSTPKREAGEA